MDFNMIDKCRSCESKKLKNVLSLGNQYLSDFIDVGGQKPGVEPLDLVLCQQCSLVQLGNTTEPQLLYNDHYGYYSGINNTMRVHLKGIVDNALSRVQLYEQDVVVDIGSNDATLLKFYPKKLWRMGFDPVKKFGKYYEEENLLQVSHYFEERHYKKVFEVVKQPYKKAKIITAISMFYDLDDPNKFVKEVSNILATDGIFIIQQNYLPSMLQNNAFDNVVHEHLEYYSLYSLERLLQRHYLEVVDAEINDLNGGSFRVYVKHMNTLRKLRMFEQRMGILNDPTYLRFGMQVGQAASKLNAFIKQEVAKGKTIYVYGASTRGNTLLQTAKLDNTLIKAAVERNPDKFGKVIASVNIPIISEEQARKEKPDYFLVLPWFFSQEITLREKDYIMNGGSLIYPLPQLTIVNAENFNSYTNSKE